MAKIAGDLGILTIAGVLPLAKALVVDRAAVSNVAITSNIDRTMTQAAREYSGNYGWSLCVYPRNTMFVVNIPLEEGGESHQYVMNTTHGAWCRFTGQDAVCWAVFQDRLFFGGTDGVVYEADSAVNDNGEPIVADMVTAYSFFGSRGNNKQYKTIRPHIVSDGRVGSAIKILPEWGSHSTATAPTNFVGNTSLSRWRWDDGWLWDDGTLWPDERVVTQNWRSVSGFGRAAAVWMRVNADSEIDTPISMEVSGFDVIYETGGLL